MVIGIEGHTNSIQKWLPLLKPHLSGVDFVETDQSNVDAVFFCYSGMDELESRLSTLIKNRIHVCAIGDLPRDTEMVERWFRLSEEAGTRIQWSNWASYSAPVQYMYGKISQPNFIRIERLSSVIQEHKLFYHDRSMPWLEDLALISKWTSSGIYSIKSHTFPEKGDKKVIHSTIRFENGTEAVLYVHSFDSRNDHMRQIIDRGHFMETNVPRQEVIHWQQSSPDKPLFKRFEERDVIKNVVQMFIRCVKLDEEPLFGTYELLRFCRIYQKLSQQLEL